MTKFMTLFVLALAFLTGVASADETTRKLSQEYVNLPGVQKMMDDMLSPDAMAAHIAARAPANARIDEKKKRLISKVMADEFKAFRPHMVAVMTAKAAEIFSAEELRALIEFYQSPHGSSIMAKMQTFSQQFLVALAPDLRNMQQKLTLKIDKIIKDEK